MKNAGLTIGMCAIGLGLASIGFNLNGNHANATPAAFNAGPAEPTIVWYGVSNLSIATSNGGTPHSEFDRLYRAWSDGTVEMRQIQNRVATCEDISGCGWVVIASPNEGLNAQADINFDERVDAADLGQLLAAWGDAPRNDHPPSDCPLGLIP